MRTITNPHDRHLILLARGEIWPGVVTIQAVRALFAHLNGIPPQWSGRVRCSGARSAPSCRASATTPAAMDDAFAGMFGYDDNDAGWQKSIDVEELILFLVGRLALAQHADCGVPDPAAAGDALGVPGGSVEKTGRYQSDGSVGLSPRNHKPSHHKYDRNARRSIEV